MPSLKLRARRKCGEQESIILNTKWMKQSRVCEGVGFTVKACEILWLEQDTDLWVRAIPPY